jgi:hypothetical protein
MRWPPWHQSAMEISGLGRSRDLMVGPVVIHHPQIEVVPDDSLVADALLGEDILRGRRSWISFATPHPFVSEPNAADRPSGVH